MKKKLLVVLLTLITVNSLMAEKVTLSTGEWPPFTSEKNDKANLAERIVTEAFKLEGVEVEYKYYPWARAMQEAKVGNIDGSFPWSRNSEREEDFYFGEEFIVENEDVYFHLKSVPFDWNTIEDLKKYKVGATLGYASVDFFKKNGIPVDSAPREELNFKKMLKGRIDVYKGSKLVGYSLINSLFTPEEAKLFTTHPKIIGKDRNWMMFSKTTAKGKMLSEKFDSGLKKLKDSGRYDEIVNTFLGL